MGHNGIIAASRLYSTADLIPPTISTLNSVTRYSISTAILNWTPASDNIGITGYNVYRSSGATDDGFTLLTTVGVQLGYNDITIMDPNDTFYYYVTALDTENESSASNHIAVAAAVASDIMFPGSPLSSNENTNFNLIRTGRYTIVTADSTVKKVGTYSAKFTSSTTNIQQYRDSFIPVTSGKEYAISFWAKASETGKCRVSSTRGLVFSIDINATTWTKYSRIVTAASTSDARIYWWTLIVGATGNGTEQMWVDDFKLYENDLSGVTTVEVYDILSSSVSGTTCEYSPGNTTWYCSSTDYPLAVGSTLYIDKELTTVWPSIMPTLFMKIDRNAIKLDTDGVITEIGICQ